MILPQLMAFGLSAERTVKRFAAAEARCGDSCGRQTRRRIGWPLYPTSRRRVNERL